MKRAYGQALVELALLISVMGAVLFWAIPELHSRLQYRYAGQQLLALHLQQVPLREQANLAFWNLDDYDNEFELDIGAEYQLESLSSDSYAFAQTMKPLWSLLNWQSGFSLPLDNLYAARLVVKEEGAEKAPWLSYLRLTDGWAPKHIHELIGRPQALTSSHYLRQLGFEQVQSLVSILPFAREFAPAQLRLGFINPDVVPNHALCDSADEYCE